MKSRLAALPFPIVLLLLLALSFGVLIPRLGLYWDDWPVVLNARQLGVSSFVDFYAGERPFSAWTYVLTIPWLGTHPLAWHIFTLLLRWLAVCVYAWTLSLLWPQRRRETTWAALLFAIYPVFINQPVAVAFSQHWMTYALFLTSLGLMLLALRRPRQFWLLSLLALLTDGVQALTMEYFWSLELLRPVMILYVLNETNHSPGKLRRTLTIWAPYLAVLALAVWMRFTVFVDPGADPNRPELLYGLLAQPLQSAARLLQISLQDLLYNLFGAWYQTFRPDDVDFTSRGYLFSLLLSAVVAGLAWLYMRAQPDKPAGAPLKSDPPGTAGTRFTWVRQAALLGLLAVLMGPLPVWLKDRQISAGLHSGRFALAAMFGLAILLVALIEWTQAQRGARLLLIASLLGLAAGYHLRSANTYARSTLLQNNFYWQLYWRAPYLQPGTAVLSADELFLYVGRNPTGTALNLLYPQPTGSGRLAYWFLELYQGIGPKQVPRLARGQTLTRTFRNFTFTGSSLDSLVVFYKPGGNRCLWVLSPRDVLNPDVPDLTRQAVNVSNWDRIEPEPSQPGYPATDLFGREPAQGWCYLYQKAELARQLGDWTAVMNLGQEARQQGAGAENPYEWLPFLEAELKLEQWQPAAERASSIYEAKPDLAPMLCALLVENPPPTDSSGEALLQVQQDLGCAALP